MATLTEAVRGTTCATCSYFPSTDCTNVDGPTQTTASTRACRLYFNVGDVERGL